MKPFQSYYWRPDLIERTDLREALSLVISNSPESKKAFEMLLVSDDPVAQGIALDHYFYAESRARLGEQNPFIDLRNEVRAVARKLLQGPPIIGRRPDGVVVVGANYASGLGALSHLGDNGDLPRIESLLLSSQDVDVLSMASFALGCIPALTLPIHIARRLTDIAASSQWPEDLRILTLGALGSARTSETLEAVAELARSAPLPYSAYAAEILATSDLERFRKLLEHLVRTWPLDAPYPAGRVRDLLLEAS